jgi:hypothetical protein
VANARASSDRSEAVGLSHTSDLAGGDGLPSLFRLIGLNGKHLAERAPKAAALFGEG